MEHDGSNLVLKVLGDNIRAIRESEKITQEKLAVMIGIERSYLNQIERGRVNPSVKKLVKIADGLDVALPELFAGLEGFTPSTLPPEVAYAAVKLPRSTKK